MREILNKYVCLIACLLVSLGVVAQPCPTCPPAGPGISIDDKLIGLFAVALFFGLYKIYISTVKKKRPI